ncbi:Fe-S protein assembly co-chaperone HscB [Kwoniella sp. CBS 9459]
MSLTSTPTRTLLAATKRTRLRSIAVSQTTSSASMSTSLSSASPRLLSSKTASTHAATRSHSLLTSISGSRFNSTSSSAAKPSQKCSSCSAAVPLPQSPCPSCSALLPLPINLSHHSMLYLSQPISGSTSIDIPAELAQTKANGYEVDKAALRKNWLLRQRDLHPDKYQTKDDGERSVSLARELSGRVNEAYNVLKDDLKRADYILSLHSRETEETDKIDDPMMLAEILEAREELEEASAQEEVDRIRADNHEKVVETTARLSQAFSQNPPDLHEAKNLAIQLRYWRGLEDAAKDKVV